MPVSTGAKEIAKRVFMALSIASTAGGSYMQEKGQPIQNKNLVAQGTALEFFGGQVDVACSLVELAAKDSRRITPLEVTSVLAQKTLSIGDFAPQEVVQCGAALGSLGITAFTTLAVSAETVGVGGYFLGANLLAETYAAKVDCSTVMNTTFNNVNNGLSSFQARLDYEIKAWIESMQLPVP